MFRSPLLLLLTCFTISTHARDAICITSPGLLPTIRDCIDIAEAVGWLSQLPRENDMKAWGRGLPTTSDTQQIPKVFWISGRGPVTCAIHVDVDAYSPFAVESFRLSDVALAAEEVIAQCLIPKRKIGLVYPVGVDGHVYAKVRTFR